MLFPGGVRDLRAFTVGCDYGGLDSGAARRVTLAVSGRRAGSAGFHGGLRLTAGWVPALHDEGRRKRRFRGCCFGRRAGSAGFYGGACDYGGLDSGAARRVTLLL